MDVKTAIKKRRAYRSLEKIKIKNQTIKELSESIRLACSCFNKQPWRFVFVTDDKILQKVFSALSSGNRWAFDSSMIIAVFSDKYLDCLINEREYYLFDTGISVGFLILKATELGLVAHPIAGFNEAKVKKVLDIPEQMRLITLIIVGKHSKKINPGLSDKQHESEKQRPKRKKIEQIIWLNQFKD